MIFTILKTKTRVITMKSNELILVIFLIWVENLKSQNDLKPILFNEIRVIVKWK